ncbi:MAG: hypothetical protein U5N85_06985 [Arcicella sp.]|nr:hypothetical protein [Arcicella sp.]
MMDNNFRYTVDVLEFCIAQKVPMLYANRLPATYGASSVFREEPGFEDPLNVYSYSKVLLRSRFASALERAHRAGYQLPLFQRVWPA